MDGRGDQEPLVTVGVCSAVERLLDRMDVRGGMVVERVRNDRQSHSTRCSLSHDQSQKCLPPILINSKMTRI